MYFEEQPKPKVFPEDSVQSTLEHDTMISEFRKANIAIAKLILSDKSPSIIELYSAQQKANDIFSGKLRLI